MTDLRQDYTLQDLTVTWSTNSQPTTLLIFCNEKVVADFVVVWGVVSVCPLLRGFPLHRVRKPALTAAEKGIPLTAPDNWPLAMAL